MSTTNFPKGMNKNLLKLHKVKLLNSLHLMKCTPDLISTGLDGNVLVMCVVNVTRLACTLILNKLMFVFTR